MDIQQSVQNQFGPVAANYASSAVHVGGPDLEAMLRALALRGDERVLDAGCGAGHTALAFAPYVASVTALDLTPAMLEQGRRLAQERGLRNISFERGDVGQLHYPDASFDLVTSRYSAHHYPVPEQALREFARVLKPGGSLLLVDVVAPDAPASDTFLNAIELLRDPSHVRDHTPGQWQAMCEAAGLVSRTLGMWPLRLELEPWAERMRTPEAARAQIRALIDGAAHAVRVDLELAPDGSAFTAPVLLLHGQKPDEDPPAPIRLETPRLLLREHELDDWHALHILESDPEVLRYLDQQARSEAEVQLALPQVIAWRYARPRVRYAFMIVERDSGAALGWCSLTMRDFAGGLAEIGYMLRRDVWGRGYGTEVARALLDFGFGDLGLRRICAECHPNNAASVRVLEKVGMRREGLLRQSQQIRGRWTDVLVYAALAQDR
ncbi:MAG TPA: GNAT family N-acetyltransferase [Roseiflexaceae bacterium]|nr:GNAT family N-acetyltransferase [Roseiflexaceae bacterium]